MLSKTTAPYSHLFHVGKSRKASKAGLIGEKEKEREDSGKKDKEKDKDRKPLGDHVGHKGTTHSVISSLFGTKGMKSVDGKQKSAGHAFISSPLGKHSAPKEKDSKGKEIDLSSSSTGDSGKDKDVEDNEDPRITPKEKNKITTNGLGASLGNVQRCKSLTPEDSGKADSLQSVFRTKSVKGRKKIGVRLFCQTCETILFQIDIICCLTVNLSANVPFYQHVCQCMSINMSVCLSMHMLSVNVNVCLPMYMSVYQCICLSINVYVCQMSANLCSLHPL